MLLSALLCASRVCRESSSGQVAHALGTLAQQPARCASSRCKCRKRCTQCRHFFIFVSITSMKVTPTSYPLFLAFTYASGALLSAVVNVTVALFDKEGRLLTDKLLGIVVVYKEDTKEN